MTTPSTQGSAEAAFDDVLETAPIGSAKTVFDGLLEEALLDADKKFAGYIGAHWKSLERPEVQDHIGEDVDVAAKGFSPETLQHGLKAQRKLLLDLLAQAHDAQSFFDACKMYIDTESNRLTFVTNDLAQARIGRDYFEIFLKEALPILEGRGFVDDDQGQELQALLDYYDLQFEAYELLRREIHKRSEGQTKSLSVYAVSNDENVDMSRDPQLVMDPKLLENDEGVRRILSRTIPVFEDILKDYNISVKDDVAPTLMLLWLGMQAKDISMLEATENPRPNMRLAEKRAMALAAHERSLHILHEIIGAIQEKGEIYGLIAARVTFDELRAKANHVPVEMPEILDEALDAAAQETLPKLAVLRQKHYETQTMRLPESHSTAKYLWTACGTLPRIQGECAEVADKLHDKLSQAGSVRNAAALAEEFIDRACEDIFFGMNEPTQILFIKEYLISFRRKLGEALMEKGTFDERHFARLKQVEDKCDAYHESFRVMKEWMLEYTESTYDHPFLACAMQFTAKTGRSLPDAVKTAEWKEDIQPAAWGMYVDVLKAMEVYKKGYAHMLIPAIMDKAQKIAQVEIGEETQFADSAAEGAYFARLSARAGEIFHEALDSIPQKDPFSGRKIKVHEFSADEILPVLAGLDTKLQQEQLRRCTPIGRA